VVAEEVELEEVLVEAVVEAFDELLDALLLVLVLPGAVDVLDVERVAHSVFWRARAA